MRTASIKQIQANRLNALQGGVKTAEGKAVSRLNARKHGVFAEALTDHDQEYLHQLYDKLAAEMQPCGEIEEMLVDKLALTWLKLDRCARAEAEYHIRTWEEPDPIYQSRACDTLKRLRKQGRHASPFRSDVFARMVDLFGRYDARLTNQFVKLLHELERRQRARMGEQVPPPLVGDFVLHGATSKGQRAEGRGEQLRVES